MLFGALDALAMLKRCLSRWKAGKEWLDKVETEPTADQAIFTDHQDLLCKDTPTSMEGFDLPLKVSTEVSGLSGM